MNTRRNDTIGLDIDLADLPTMLHALQLQANTCMLCGEPAGQAAMIAMRDRLKQSLPKQAAWFTAESWAGMVRAARTAQSCAVTFQPADRRYDWSGGHAVRLGTYLVTIDGQCWTTDARLENGEFHWREDSGLAAPIAAFLEEITPLDVKIVIGDPATSEPARDPAP